MSLPKLGEFVRLVPSHSTSIKGDHLRASNNLMKLPHFCYVVAYLLVSSGYSIAQNAISIRECVLEPAQIAKTQPQFPPYVLRLKVAYSLASQETALLKIAVDPKEEQSFLTIAEKRLRKGKGVLLQFEIPIEDWKTEKLNVFLLMIGKGDEPLANVTKAIEKAAAIKQ